MTPDQIKKWKTAYPEIDASDDALAGMPDCASLYANDFLVALAAKGNEAVPFLRAICRELVWAYGNWQKAQRDGKAELLMADLLNNAKGGPQYDFARKFLRDYMKANNIKDVSAAQQAGAPDFDKMLADFDTKEDVKPL